MKKMLLVCGLLMSLSFGTIVNAEESALNDSVSNSTYESSAVNNGETDASEVKTVEESTPSEVNNANPVQESESRIENSIAPEVTNTNDSLPEEGTEQPSLARVSWETTYRLYNPNSGAHFFTTSSAERNHLVTVGWRYEHMAWMTTTTGASPTYRLYNPNSGEHLYTVQAAEKDMLVRAGWRYEKVAFRSSKSPTTNHSVGVYRLFNPNAGPNKNSHHYTAFASEANQLQKLGWRIEGHKFFVRI